MSSFEDALRQAVSGIEKGLQEAEADLLAAVVPAAQDVERISNGAAKLQLVPVSDDPEDGKLFDLVLSRRKGQGYWGVAAFLLSPRGYPVKAGRTSVYLKMNNFEALIQNKDGLAKYLLELASNRDSALVLRLAFLMRQDQSAQALQPP
jgi:hypothetical protein